MKFTAQGTIKKEQTKPKSKVGFGSVWTKKTNVNALNALKSTLGYKSQDETLHNLLARAYRSLSTSQKAMFDVLLKSETNRK